MGNLGMHVLVGYYVAYDIKAGADFGTRLASPGPKANLVSPTTVGECASQEPPWYQVRVRYLGLMAFRLRTGTWLREKYHSGTADWPDESADVTFLPDMRIAKFHI